MNRRPDILGEFTAEHRAVEELLVRIEAGRAEGRAPGALLDQLTDLLLNHCAAEEEHLFPVVQHDVPDGGAVVFRCIHDHLAIGQYLSDLQALPMRRPGAGHPAERAHRAAAAAPGDRGGAALHRRPQGPAGRRAGRARRTAAGRSGGDRRGLGNCSTGAVRAWR